MQRVIVLLILSMLCSCDQRAADFQEELRAKAAESGLAVGYISSSRFEILALTGEQYGIENYSGPCGYCPGWFSADGKFITWYFLEDPTSSHLSVQTIDGRLVASWFGDLVDLDAVALSPDHTRVALEVRRYSGESSVTGLQYVVLGTPKRVILEQQSTPRDANKSRSIGWSPDGQKLVYSRQGKIIVLDVMTGARKEIAEGSNPAWAPDGRWISFTSADMRPMLVDPSSLKQVALFGGRKITGAIKWSPDSCCLAFSDVGTDIEDIVRLAGGRMIAYRLSDGAWFPFARFSFKGGNSDSYGWLYNYKEFIERNRLNGVKQRVP